MSQAPYLPPVTSDVIIDLSHWDTVSVDFSQVAETTDVEAVILKATQGTGFVDPTFLSRAADVRAAGLLVGAYHFLDGSDPTAQVIHFLEVAYDQGGVNWLAIDWEPFPSSQATRIQTAVAVMEAEMVTGHYPVLYMNRYMLPMASQVLSFCPLWLAEYGTRPICPPGFTKWRLWQHTDGNVGSDITPVPGIGYCDRSRFAGTAEQLKAWWANPV